MLYICIHIDSISNVLFSDISSVWIKTKKHRIVQVFKTIPIPKYFVPIFFYIYMVWTLPTSAFDLAMCYSCVTAASTASCNYELQLQPRPEAEATITAAAATNTGSHGVQRHPRNSCRHVLMLQSRLEASVTSWLFSHGLKLQPQPTATATAYSCSQCQQLPPRPTAAATVCSC